MIKNNKNKLIVSLFMVAFLFSFLFLTNNLLAQDPGSDLDFQERDAIAVRVLPNPNNYSIESWYKKQGFAGSPQSLVVDGYQAIRDGRTVYVNAANVSGNLIYTNIYLISYNQDPDIKTVDILARIINSWQLNRNLLNNPGVCRIASQSCSSDNDCSGDLVCRTEASEDPNNPSAFTSDLRCRLPENIELRCLIDSHCPGGIYCDSLKAKVTRDVLRLGYLTNIRENLENYKNINGNYPILESGTYIKHHSLSVWPSWQQLFLPQISLTNKLDPINILGHCGEAYDPITCWDEELSQFYNFDGNNLIMPEESYAFAYSSNSNGSDFNLCAVLESNLEGYDNAEGNLSSQSCLTEGTGFEGAVDLEAPSLHSYNLKGLANKEFSGFIRVNNPSGHPLTWNLNIISAWSSWSANPVLQDTNNPKQKRLWASKAGDPGTYPINLVVSDSLGNSFSENLQIEITGSSPFIEMPNIEYYLNPNKALEFTAKITDSNTPISLNSLSSGLSGMASLSSETIGDSLFASLKQNVTGVFPEDMVSQGTIVASNNLGISTTKNFNISVKVTRPILDFVCLRQARFNKYYECFLGLDKQGDFDIEYFSNSTLPNNLKLEKTSDNEWFLKGVPSNSSDIGKNYEINISAKNNYDTQSNRQFNLGINSYCGDGVLQKPNTEGGGGFYNDGNEDCDGTAGTTNDPTESNINLQYGCQMGDDGETPYPILSTNYCVFKAPLLGGGFCGDSVCQAQFENNSTCPEDCVP
jgi:hypothetical protein